MIDVRDQADMAADNQAMYNEIALRQFTSDRIKQRKVLSDCEACGNPIELARQQADTVDDIVLCIECATYEEAHAKRYGRGIHA